MLTRKVSENTSHLTRIYWQFIYKKKKEGKITREHPHQYAPPPPAASLLLGCVLEQNTFRSISYTICSYLESILK